MLNDSKLAIAILHEFFPIRARYLGRHLIESNKTVKVLEEWREQQLFKFIGLLSQNAEDLEQGYVENRITKVAWAARNLLELSIWIGYCNLSDAHARRFRDDSARDLLGVTKAVQSLYTQGQGSPDPGLDRTKQELATFAQNVFGGNSLDDDFKRARDAAQELGRQARFLDLNKLFSKFAHPTSIALNSVVAVEADAGIRLMFLNDGVKLATDSLTTTKDEIVRHFPLPTAAAPSE